MNQGVIRAINDLVSKIYSIDQVGLNEAFSAFIEELSLFLNRMAKEGYTVEMEEELVQIQQAFEKKDYILLADVLLYQVKPGFAALDL